jgi:hypothetical protein
MIHDDRRCHGLDDSTRSGNARCGARRVGLPGPAAIWLGCLIPELVLPFVIAIARHAVP